MKDNMKMAREIYEGFYKIAEIMNSSSYTRDLSLFVDRFLTNRIQGAWDDIEGNGGIPSKESKDLVMVIRTINKGYSPKFEKLVNKQEEAIK